MSIQSDGRDFGPLGDVDTLVSRLRNMPKEEFMCELELIHVLAASHSLFLPQLDSKIENGWSNIYLMLASKRPRLEASLAILSSMGLPRPLDNLLTMEILHMGEQSRVMAFLAETFERINNEPWRTPLGGEVMEAFLAAPSSSQPGMNEVMDHVNRILREQLQRLLSPEIFKEYQYSLQHVAVGRFGFVLSLPLLESMSNNDHHVTWNEILWYASYFFHSGSEVIPSDHIVINTVIKDDPMENFMYLMHRNRTWGEKFLGMSQMERLAVHKALQSWIKTFHRSWDEGKPSPLTRSIMEAQELVTPSRVLEYSKVVEEYNEEWAMASFDFTGGESSHINKLLRAILESTPRTKAKVQHGEQ